MRSIQDIDLEFQSLLARPRAAVLHLDGPVLPIAARVADLAEHQLGVVAHAQLLALGMSRSQIQRWCRIGHFSRLHPRVYAVGHASLSYSARVMAALLSLGAGSAAAGRSAAYIHQIYDRGRPFVEVVSSRRHRGLDDVALRFTRSLDDAEVTRSGVLAVTTVARTIVDLAEHLTVYQVAFAIHEARRLRLVSVDQLVRAAIRHRTRRGHGCLVQALELHLSGSAGTRSPAEDDFLRMVREAGLPEPCTNMFVTVGRRKWELDFHWPELRLNVEVDGGEHRTTARRLQDEERDAALRAAGWTVIRVPPSFLQAGLDALVARLAGSA